MTHRQTGTPRQNIFVRPLLIGVFIYFATLGATFNGVLLPSLGSLSLAIMTTLFVLWLVIRWRKGWQWHRIPLGRVLLLGAGAIALSILANPETTRRSLIGVWFLLVYGGVWVILHDSLANGALKRSAIVDALLVTGLIIILIGYLQLVNGLATTGALVRPVSLIGNVNALAAFLLVIIPLSLVRVIVARIRVVRMALGMYTLAAIGLLMLTFSRGGWAGLVVAILCVALLVLRELEMLSRDAFRQWWQGQSTTKQWVYRVLGLVIILGVLAGSLWIVHSFSIQGRTLSLRTHLWESAIEQFAEKPLTGQGLYTFGRDFALGTSMPPMQPHSHAHSIPLNVAAELGILGLIVLGIAVVVTLRIFRKSWQLANAEKPVLIGAVSALLGFGVHHLVDTPAMMPLVALMGLLVWILVCASLEQNAMTQTTRKTMLTVGVVVLAVLVLVSGFWSNGVYTQYIEALQYAFETDDYAGGAERLQSVVEADPSLAVYSMQAGYLWAFAAEEGDTQATQNAIAAYEHFLALEPLHAVSWANKAALHWQLDEPQAAIDAIERALDIAPDYTFFEERLALYQGEAQPDDAVPDYLFGPNVGRFQFLREVPQDDFIPQVGWGSR